MRTIKALSKQLYGARYEQLRKTVLVCFILFAALYAAEIRIAIAPFVLYLTASAFSAGAMWHALNAAANTGNENGLFMLPFDNRQFVFSYAAAYSGYVLVTKTLPVFAIFFAVGTWDWGNLLTAFVCGCNGCFMIAAWFTVKKRAAFVWGAAILIAVIAIFCTGQSFLFLWLSLLGITLAVCCFYRADAYLFFRTAKAKSIRKGSQKKGGVFLYLLRYLAANKHYLMNTFGLWAIACFLPFLFGNLGSIKSLESFGNSESLAVLPLGFAVLSLNTPVCILLSCDTDLEQAVRALPRQGRRFFLGYWLFISIVNMTGSSIYLCAWQFLYGGIGLAAIMTGIVFCLQSALLSVLLEWFMPLRNWKNESELLHHPRKYLVPVLMMILAAFAASLF